MAFISKVEREKRTKKLYGGNTFRKIWLILTCIASGLFIAYTSIALGVTAGYKSNFSGVNQFAKFFVLATENEETGIAIDDKKLWILMVCAITVGAMLLISLILTFTFKSNKKIANEAVKLVSTPTGGRQPKNKSVAAKARERLGKE